MGEDDGAGRAEGDSRPDAEFDPFYRRVYPELLKYGTGLCGDRQDAHDAATITMLEIRKRWGGIENRDAYARRIFPWHLFRLQKRNRRCIVTDPAELPEPGFIDDTYTEIDERLYVDRLLSRLPPKQQEVLRGLVASKSYADMVDEERARRLGPVITAAGTAITTQEPATIELGTLETKATPADAREDVRRAAAKRKLAQLARRTIQGLIRDDPDAAAQETAVKPGHGTENRGSEKGI